MKKLSLLLTCLLFLVSCNATTSDASSEGKDEVPKGESIHFLDAVGIASTRLDRLGDKLNLSLNGFYYTLSEDQRVKLLNDIYHFDSDMDGMQSIIGVKPLAGGHTMVLFHNEFGDLSSQEIVIYNNAGEITDHLETGSALSDNFLEANEDMTHGMSLHNTVTYKFKEAEEMELNREYYQYEWESDGDKIEPLRTVWKLKKTYKYLITPEGKFEFAGITTEKEGDIDPQELLIDEIGDLQMRPASDIKRLDEANALAVRPDVLKDIQEEGSAQWQMTTLLWGIFQENPQALLSWLSSHRGKSNHLLDLFKSLFLNGTINKSRLVEEIDKMKDDKARKYLDDLTAQWGPIDAVG